MTIQLPTCASKSLELYRCSMNPWLLLLIKHVTCQEKLPKTTAAKRPQNAAAILGTAFLVGKRRTAMKIPLRKMLLL